MKPWPVLMLNAALSLASPASYALQLVEASDGTRAEAVIAAREPTRIRIESASIKDVYGSIYSSNCSTPVAAATTAPPASASTASTINPTGEIIIECDRDKGEIYVRPMGRSTKPVNLFISSATATYTLLLRRSNTSSDTIVIRDKSEQSAGAPGDPRQDALGKSAHHVRAMKSLLVAMASDRAAKDLRVEEVNRPVPLWNEATFSLMRTYQTRGLIGEKYLLTNVSDHIMVLTEQEFDRPDDRVIGVAIDNMNLRPGDSTGVYVIRLGK